jgi:aryl-alcohol dehydrogenase-like predicted oxidoreductase
MELRKLGNTDMLITPVGFGAWAIGGGNWEYGWGDQDDQESIDAIHYALDKGMNWIDTAAVYGLGHSEEVVAKALHGMRERPYVFTKSSLVWGEDRKVFNRQKADSIRQECEDSLRRLQVEVIDLYQVHWPFPDEDIEEGWAAMAELQQAGKVLYIGVSNYDVAQLQRCQGIAPVSSLQPPYSLVHPEVGEEILPYCLEQNIGVIVYSPMQSGLLTGTMTRERVASMPDNDWRKRDDDFKEPRLSRNLALADLLVELAAPHGRTAAEAAVAWTLNNPAVTGAIVGARRPDQIDGIIGAMDFRLNEAELARIDAWLQANP